MKKEEILKLATLFNGDNIEVLKTLAENSIDSIVTDPPYGISFMGKKWDYDVPSVDFWKEIFRVLKPGGHVLSFGGTRTYHRMVINIEDAGFEIRDQIMWIYSSGFPKSHNIGKAVDKFGGNNLLDKEIGNALKQARLHRGISLTQADKMFCDGTSNYSWFEGRKNGQRIPNKETFDKIVDEWPELQELRNKVRESQRDCLSIETTNKTVMQKIGDKNETGIYHRTKGDSEFEGWGTGLKPANEPICVARKPISEKSIASNVLKWGTGGINVDGCRIGSELRTIPIHSNDFKDDTTMFGLHNTIQHERIETTVGRFPANFIIECICENENHTDPDCPCRLMDEHSSGASRFFYVAKVSKKERNLGLDNFEEKETKGSIGLHNVGGSPTKDNKRAIKNTHPTVKPIELMRYLVRLVTPKGGVVLDPFMGSGSTGVATLIEGFKFVGIEMDEDYFQIAKQRVKSFKKFSLFFEEKEIKKQKSKARSKKKDPGNDPNLGFWSGRGLDMAA
jgi:DNA modification methylase